ncbi:MAG: class I SAM-dependent methyltransferase [Pseudomonadota bacterium]|nr:class I SAM-dependent methyltransferase [Pseudomonadota bacterium]
MSDRCFYEGVAEPGGQRTAPAVARNREPIANVLADWLPASGLLLEIASGTGEHAIHFAGRFPGLDWQPSDPDANALASIAAWREEAGLANLRTPLRIDAAAAAADWPVERADAILSINMVHISPWAAALGLLDGAARLLAPGAPLILYGPWIEKGVETAPSNVAFDQSLRERDPEWGLRHVETFAAEAAARGLALLERRKMPANNLLLLLRRT